jgi:hypothetical protein
VLNESLKLAVVNCKTSASATRFCRYELLQRGHVEEKSAEGLKNFIVRRRDINGMYGTTVCSVQLLEAELLPPLAHPHFRVRDSHCVYVAMTANQRTAN